MKESDAPQVCPECLTQVTKSISVTDFVLAGDGWPGKNLKIKGQMGRKNRKVSRKQKDHWAGKTPTLTPNVGGEQVDSWSEAKKLAGSKGKNTGSYEPSIRKESVNE